MKVEVSWAANWHCPFCSNFTDEDLDSDIVEDHSEYWYVECGCGKKYTLDKETGGISECN